MRLSDLGIGLLCGAIVPVMSTGCDDDGGSSADAGTSAPMTGADDGDDDDGSGTGSATGAADADGSGTAGGSTGMADSGPPDTDGDPSPEIECGDGVYDGTVIIDPNEAVAVLPEDVLNGISVIDGDLLISNTTYIDLNFLHCLTEVRGDIQIFNNYFLKDMSGTDTMTKVGRLPELNPTPLDPNFVDEGAGTITISGNPELPDINGFNGIVQVGEQDTRQPSNMQLSPQSLVIRNNPVMTTLTGFGNLQLIYASLIIQQNDSLMDIDGLIGLQGVGAAFSVTRNPMLCISSVNAVGGGLMVLGEPENSTTSQNNEGC